MRVGLFMCDHVSQEKIKTFGDYSDMFIQLFPELDFVLYDVINGEFPDDLEHCAAYFATGSLWSVYDDQAWIAQLKETVRELYRRNIFFVGFCFGHQLIGAALGGKVQKAPTGWCIGVQEFLIRQREAWMLPFQPSYKVLMMCQDQILQLPPNAKVLAGNTQCPVGLLQVGEKILGIQGHPEFSKAYDQYLLEKRRARIGDALVQKGISSLQNKIDPLLIKQWVLAFLGKHKSA